MKQKSRYVFKNKDDLRMDQLIMQILHLFEDLTHEFKIDLKLTIYDC